MQLVITKINKKLTTNGVPTYSIVLGNKTPTISQLINLKNIGVRYYHKSNSLSVQSYNIEDTLKQIREVAEDQMPIV